MKIARPPRGFRIRLNLAVQAYVDEILEQHPDFGWRWDAVVERLKATGHVDGDAMNGNGCDRAGVFMVDEWRIKLAWRVVGDLLTVLKAEF